MTNLNKTISVNFVGNWKATELKDEGFLSYVYDWISQVHQRVAIKTMTKWLSEFRFTVLLCEGSVGSDPCYPLHKEYQPGKFIVLYDLVNSETCGIMTNLNKTVSVKFVGNWKATELKDKFLLTTVYAWIREVHGRVAIKPTTKWLSEFHFTVALINGSVGSNPCYPLHKEYQPGKFIVLYDPVNSETCDTPRTNELSTKCPPFSGKTELPLQDGIDGIPAAADNTVRNAIKTDDQGMMDNSTVSKEGSKNNSQKQRLFKVRPAGKQYASFHWVECAISDTLRDTIANVANVLSGFFDQQKVVIENLKDCEGTVVTNVSQIADGESIFAVISVNDDNCAANAYGGKIGAGVSDTVPDYYSIPTALYNSLYPELTSFVQPHASPIPMPTQSLLSQRAVQCYNSDVQKAFRSFFFGQLSDSEIMEQVEKISKTTDLNVLTNFETDFLHGILNAPSPLVAAVGPLLSMARRLHCWNSIFENLDDLRNNLFEFDIDAKSVLVLLQHVLPPLKSKQLYEQFSAMHTPLPFAICVRDQKLCSMVCTADGTVLMETHVLALHFRDLFADIIPIVLSVGLGDISGKSTFVNKCFDCNFEEKSENSAFHNGSIDVSISTKRKQLNFHIFDCHCDVTDLHAGLFESLVNISSVVLLHISMTSFENTEQLIETLEIIGDRCSVILLLRDTPSSTTSGQLLSKLPARISDHVKLICVPRLTQDGKTFNRSFRKLVKEEVCPCIQQALARRFECGATQTRYLSLYEVIEERLKICLKTEGVVLKSRTDNILSFSDKLKKHLFPLPLKENLARLKLFPLSALYRKSCKIEEQLHNQSQYLESQPESFTAHGLRLHNIEKQLKQCKEPHRIIYLLLKIAECSDIEAYTEFQAIVSCFNFCCDNTGSKTLPVELFWREMFLILKHNKSYKQDTLIHFQNLLLIWGFPLEIVDGDTLTLLDLNLMSLILSSVTSKEPLVCSVLGPQSSGKSTLCNSLFGSNFAVSAGRCTQGMQMSLFESLGRDDPCLVVLDSEGLLSIQNRGGAFDTKMTLMLVALSHVVLINVKGEIGIEMKNVLEVTLLAVKKLDVINAHPQLVFVLRDMADLNISKQNESIVRIENGMKDICSRIGLDFNFVSENSFMLLPSAFNDCPVSYYDGDTAFFYASTFYSSQNNKFNNSLQGVINKIRSAKERTPGNSVPFVSLAEWASHANNIWEVLRGSGDMLYYKTLQEYFDRIHLSGLVASLIQEMFAGELFALSKKAERDILSDLCGSSGVSDKILMERFENTVTDLKLQFLCMAIQRFDEAVSERRCLQELVDEYRNCLNRRAEVFVNTCIHEFDCSIRSFFVSESIQENIDAVKHWIDTYSSSEERPDETKQIAEFNVVWERQMQVMRIRQMQLRKDPRGIEEHLKSSINFVLKSVPAFQRYTIVKYNDAVAIVDFLVSKAGTTSGINGETLRSYVSFSTARNFSNFVNGQYPTSVRNIFQHFVVQLRHRVDDFLKSVKKICNDTQIYRGLQIVNENICDTENQLQNNGCRFKSAVYGLCFSYFHYRCFDKLTEEEHMSMAENLRKFDSYRDVLQNSFVRLLRSRNDYIDSVQHISESFVRSLEEEATKFISDECAVRMRSAGYISSVELVELCENRVTKPEILEYILNCTSFMYDVFKQQFDSRLASMQPEFDRNVKAKIRDYVELLQQAVNCWSATVGDSSFAVLWNKLLSSADSAISEPSCPTADVVNILFKSFKAFLMSSPQPEITMSGELWVQLGKCFGALANKGQQAVELRKLFNLLPGSFPICNPKKFTQDLLASVGTRVAQGNLRFTPDYSSLDSLRNTMANEAIGCQEKCCLCGAKCSLPDDGHSKHKTENHRMAAFAGWHKYNTKCFNFNICTGKAARTESYRHDSCKDHLPFELYMNEYHPDWIIQYKPDSTVSTKNILRWLRVRKELVDHYDLEDNTPRHWLVCETGYCPICIEMLGGCGNKCSLSCGHEIGANCLDALYCRPACEHFCPVCCGPLS